MGLDQYLITNSKGLSHALNKPQDGMEDYEARWVEYQAKSEIVCQWRKANQIHKWFVDHVQNGNDDCGTHEVGVEQLKELLNAIDKVLGSTKLVDGMISNGYSFDNNGKKVYHMEERKVLEDTSTAKELLPTQEGFFFGGTDYDQHYWAGLEYTKKRLEDILGMVERDDNGYDWHFKGEDDWDITFQYSSSW